MSKTDFEIFGEMAKANEGIRMCPDIVGADYSERKKGTIVKVGVPGNLCNELINNEVIAVLYIVNKKQFFDRKKRIIK